MALSLSARVRFTELTVRPVAVPATPMVSSPSYTLSSDDVSLNVPVPVESPAAILTLKLDTAV